MNSKTLIHIIASLVACATAASAQTLSPNAVIWENNFEANSVGASTGANPGVINGFRFNFPGGVVRDSSSVAPFGENNRYLELSPNNNPSVNSGYRAIINGVLKAAYIATPVGFSFDFNESIAAGFDTIIGFATASTDSAVDLNPTYAVVALKFRNGAVTVGDSTSIVSGSLPSFTQGVKYRITYITNFTGVRHKVLGPDNLDITLEPMQMACWIHNPTAVTYASPIIVANNNSRALDAHLSLIFRHSSTTAATQRQTIYVDNLLATNFAVPTPTWVGNGSDALWSTAANWSQSTVPAANDNIVFTGSQNLLPDNNLALGTAFTNISFETTSSSFTLTGNGIELLGTLSNSSSVNQTVEFPLLLSSTRTITNNTTGTHLHLNGLISGGGRISKTGAGTVALGGANTYSGGTTITGTGVVDSHALEVLQLANGGLPSSLGNSSSGAENLIINAAELRYTGTGDTTDRLFTLAATAFITNNGSGPLTFSNTAAIQHSNTGTTRTLNLGGTFTASPNVFTPQITDTGSTGLTGLTARGGTWAVSGNNTFTGNVTINFGAKLSVQSDANLGAATGAGKFTLAGTLICTEDITLNSGRGIYAGSSTAAGNAIIEVAENKTATHNGVISNHLGGSAVGADGLIKSGLGTLVLGAANTHTGTSTVFAGTLSLGASGTINSSPTISVRGGATLDLSAKAAAFSILATQTLTGAGTVQGQSLNVAGSIAPGNSGIGALGTDSVAMAANSILTIQINSTAATSDTLAVNGDITLDAETTLSLADIATAPELIPNGSKLTLITYNGSRIGTFKNLPEGSTVVVGDNKFSLSYTDASAITLTSTNAISATPFVVWIDSFLAITDPAEKEKNADPDGDGRSNFEEFAFDGDPSNPSSDRKSQSDLVLVDGLNYLTLTIPVRDSAVFTGSPALISAAVDGLIYGIRGSYDLSGFAAGVVEVSPAITTGPPLNPGWSYRSFRLSANSSEQPRGFLRSEVTAEVN
jgi:autotransporter-associated beta strand protein